LRSSFAQHGACFGPALLARGSEAAHHIGDIGCALLLGPTQETGKLASHVPSSQVKIGDSFAEGLRLLAKLLSCLLKRLGGLCPKLRHIVPDLLHQSAPLLLRLDYPINKGARLVNYAHMRYLLSFSGLPDPLISGGRLISDYLVVYCFT
jgi:hypothetical protein